MRKIDYPIYYKNERRKYRSSPKELKEIILQYYPLTKEFIDWTIKQGFKIQYTSSWEEGTGEVFWNSRRIMLSSQGGKKLIDKVLVHEIVHILIPGIPNPYEELREREEFEKAIEEVTDVYLNDLELIKYIRQKIPVFQDNKWLVKEYK